MDSGDRVQVRYTQAIDGIARYLFAVIVFAIGVATVAGCDGSSTGEGTPVTGADSAGGTATGTAAIADGPTSPNDGSISLALQRDLSARLLRDGEVLGMTPNSSKRFLTPQELAKSDLDGKLVGRSVSFVAGPYEYIIGFAPDPAVGEAWTRGQLAAAAAAWYHRVSAG